MTTSENLDNAFLALAAVALNLKEKLSTGKPITNGISPVSVPADGFQQKAQPSLNARKPRQTKGPKDVYDTLDD